MKTQVRNFVRAAVVAGSVFAVSAANAAIDISAGTAESKADIVAGGTLIIGVILAIAGVAWLKRLIK